MYELIKGVVIGFIQDGKSWDNLKNFETVTVSAQSYLDKEDLVIDCTGISTWAAGPDDKGEAGKWARKGYYGFRFENSFGPVAGLDTTRPGVYLVRHDKAKYVS